MGSAASAKWIVSPAASSRGTGSLTRSFGPGRSARTPGELADALGRLAEAGDAAEVLLGRAVREVDSGDIDAGAEDRFEALGGVGRRPEGGDDLGAAGHS